MTPAARPHLLWVMVELRYVKELTNSVSSVQRGGGSVPWPIGMAFVFGQLTPRLSFDAFLW